jgi:hypothetical protein
MPGALPNPETGALPDSDALLSQNRRLITIPNIASWDRPDKS